MTSGEAFWLGVTQASEIVLLPFIVLLEWLTGRSFGRINEDLRREDQP